MKMKEEKIELKISSKGSIVIPKNWREKMDLKDGSIIELEFEENIIKLRKKSHPIEECEGLFDGTDFEQEDHEQANKSLWRM